MSGQMKAIETIYDGHRFRSRLEARWAVFFNTIGIKYEYEKEGFEFENGVRYLPDFYLPHAEFGVRDGIWIEIKASEPTTEEREKAYGLHDVSPHPVFIFSGGFSPRPLGYFAMRTHTNDSPDYSFAQCQFCGKFFISHPDRAHAVYHPCVPWNRLSGVLDGLADMQESSIQSWFQPSFLEASNTLLYGHFSSPDLLAAYDAARMARFEYGETPR